MVLSNRFLGGLSEKDFLQNYWEKQPLLIKNAVPHASSLIDKDLMLDMAFEEEIESRFVFQDVNKAWHLFHDPLTKELINNYSGEAWTLINHATNLFHKPLYDLQKEVRFIPQWNFDDIMITYSMPGGNVAPHIDSYNVFIVQGHGTKRWQLNRNPDPTIYPDQELKILSNFESKEEYILEEGDMLYIPPHVAHYGVSLSEGMSYSLGFNSVRPAKFIESIYHDLNNKIEDDDILNLPFKQERTPYQFTDSIEKSVLRLWDELTRRDNLIEMLRSSATIPRYWPDPNEHIYFEEFLDLLVTNPLYRHPYIRFNFSGLDLYINQQKYRVANKAQRDEMIKFLDQFPMEKLPTINHFYEDNYTILYQLYLHGALFFGIS